MFYFGHGTLDTTVKGSKQGHRIGFILRQELSIPIRSAIYQMRCAFKDLFAYTCCQLVDAEIRSHAFACLALQKSPGAIPS